MYVVSGCPRNGTSSMMRIFDFALGSDRMIASKFPQEERERRTAEAISKMPPWLRYVHERERAEDARTGERKERARDMNPNGYFEMEWSVKGAHYTLDTEEEFRRIQNEDKPSVCKVVSSGLRNTDPSLVDKVVYMVRDPRSVAKSQERLTRGDPMNPEDAPEKNGERQLVRDVAMFIQSSMIATEYFTAHPEIPVLIVQYENLIDDPIKELKRIQDFIGEGDFVGAKDLIDPSLKRSVSEPLENKEAEVFAMSIYTLISFGDWQGILDAQKARAEATREKMKDPDDCFCFRTGQNATRGVCNVCRKAGVTLGNMIDSVNKFHRNINWKEEPCTRDLIEGKTPEESIANNHWVAFIR